jgi:Putative lumazine-binding
MIRGIGFAAASMAVLLGLKMQATPSQTPSDDDRIRLVLKGYVEGWRDADTTRLAKVFARQGRMFWSSGGSVRDTLMSMTFGQTLARRKEQPEYGKAWSVMNLDIVDGQLAVAKLSISRAGGSYVDYLVLEKIASDWRIVTKTWVTR